MAVKGQNGTIQLKELKENLINEIKSRQEDKILEKPNAELLIKLISNAKDLNEAINIAALGTTYKRTGFHFDKRLEKLTDTIKYFKKNEKLSFEDKNDKNAICHKLIIGDNYDALQNLLIEYRKKIDVIYIDPPYGKDKMGEFAETNYDNAITRDNLLSMLYNRLVLAKELMTEDGVIFCSIDDRNQAYVKCLFDEVFDERNFIFNIPRLIKKGGKSTYTIAKNSDYILGYAKNNNIVFSKEKKSDLKKYKYEDEFVETRGKYALTQTLDYDSLKYSKNMDYEIEFEGRIFVPGGDYNKHLKRLKGEHGINDWVWRWSKDAVEWGKKENFFVLKNNRIYTKSYMYCKKIDRGNGIEYINPEKAYTSLSYIDNKYSNDNGKKQLDLIFNEEKLFNNPKSVNMIIDLLKMTNRDKNGVILDFFSGSGTTGQAVLELNKEDGGNRQFILCTNNEKTDINPNGIALDVTTKRLKRVMTGKCYDGKSNFEWIKKNEALGGALDVYDIKTVANFENTKNKTPFDVIDETLYGKEKFKKVSDKIKWVCENFEHTQMTEKE